MVNPTQVTHFNQASVTFYLILYAGYNVTGSIMGQKIPLSQYFNLNNPTLLTPGEHSITAILTDPNGNMSTTTAEYTMDPMPKISLKNTWRNNEDMSKGFTLVPVPKSYHLPEHFLAMLMGLGFGGTDWITQERQIRFGVASLYSVFEGKNINRLEYQQVMDVSKPPVVVKNGTCPSSSVVTGVFPPSTTGGIPQKLVCSYLNPAIGLGAASFVFDQWGEPPYTHMAFCPEDSVVTAIESKRGGSRVMLTCQKLI